MSITTLAEDVGLLGDDAKLICDVAFQLIEAGDLDGAISLFTGLLALNPRDAATRAALGATLHQAGRLAEAEAEYDTALSQNPKTALALVNRGALRLSRGDDAGRRDLQLAVTLDSPVRDRAQRLLRASAR